jgi:A118 family predicted phage portal protein
VWPPEPLAPIYQRLASWAAWYSGSPDDLARAYGAYSAAPYDTTALQRVREHPSQYRGGVVGWFARFFWGEPFTATQKNTKLHIPIASDIAATSADLLFSEPPTITVKDETTQKRLDELIDDGVHATLLEAAEVCAALGGAYLRVCWDQAMGDKPWLDVVHADAAVPEWKWGRLSAVTFWRELSNDGTTVFRHLERHEPGKILHGLYKGTPTELGKSAALESLPQTEAIAEAADDTGMIATGIKQLDVVYVPNMRPNRLWRSLPAGAPYGRSDFSGTEQLMDALDETYSSWMRDIRLGKARLIVPKIYLQSLGAGDGAHWDPEREVYESVEMLGDPSQMQITENQFAIRVTEHKETAYDLMTRIVSAAGYESQTFGLMGENAVALTATEVAARERKSFITRQRKINYWRPALMEIIETLLAIDQAVFNSGITPSKPDLEWGDGVSEDPTTVAQTVQALHAAESASTEVRVAMVHPDWDETQVTEEVTKIQGEQQAMNVSDPFGGMGSGGSDTPPDQQQQDPAAAYGGSG